MLDWLRRLLPRTRPPRRPAAPVRARYDAAQTTDDNRRHWAAADGLSARAALALTVRKAVRERARHEYGNNGYCQGLVNSLVNGLVGTGPRLQVQLPSPEASRAVESAWAAWAAAAGLVPRLQLLARAKKVDGEAFGVLATNERIAHPVQLDLRVVECDQFTDPSARWVGNAADGVQTDEAGNVVGYCCLRTHPGDVAGQPLAWDVLPARQVLHWFRADRPGQVRGLSELAPSLGLFGQLRRYTLAVLTAAETAADFAALVETQAPPDAESDEVEPFSSLEIERGMMTTLPAGGKISQLKAEQPTTTYGDFVTRLLREIGRPLHAPLNVTALDSSSYNYSSARLDHLLHQQALEVERDHLRAVVLEPLFAAWLEEAVRIPGLLPEGAAAGVPHAWHWPATPPIDPVKDAQADQINLANRTTSLTEIAAARGRDPEDILRELARERQLAESLGLAPPPAPPPAPEEDPADGPP